MSILRCFFLGLAVLIPATLQLAGVAQDPAPTEGTAAVLERYRKSIVHVRIIREVQVNQNQIQRQQLWVPGIVVGPDGLILVLGHVVFGNGRMIDAKVFREDGTQFDATYLGKPEDLNVAFLRVRVVGEAQRWDPVVFQAESSVKVGDRVTVVAILSEALQFTRYSLATEVAVALPEPRPVYLLGATLGAPNQEALLGALVCAPDGTPLGVLGMELAEAQGGRIYTRSGAAMLFTSDLIARAVANPPQGSTDSPQPGPGPQGTNGWIGVNVQLLTEDLATLWSLPGRKGVVVQGPSPGGPAERAGLRSGDVIVSWDGAMLDLNPANWSQVFLARVHQTPPGTRVTLGVLRSGQEIQIPVDVEPLRDERPVQFIDRQFGVRVQSIPDSQRVQMNLPTDEGGVAIAQVTAGGWFQRARIVQNQILVEMNSVRIRDLAHFQELLEQFRRERPEQIVCLIRGGPNFAQTVYTTIRPTWEAEYEGP